MLTVISKFKGVTFLIGSCIFGLYSAFNIPRNVKAYTDIEAMHILLRSVIHSSKLCINFAK